MSMVLMIIVMTMMLLCCYRSVRGMWAGGEQRAWHSGCNRHPARSNG